MFVANGHVEDRTWAGTGEPYRMPPQVFHNAGNGRFVEVSANAGEYFRNKWLGRGTAVADFDRDGRIDLAVNHQLAPTEILLNRTQCDPISSLRLIGTRSNRNATGCKIETLDNLGKLVGIRISSGGTSFQAANSSEIMPLTLKSQPYKIRICWPSGLIEEQKAPMQNPTVIIEGTGDRMPINTN
ncbi:MAG: VCBS repeat-containing protein [Pirellulales bacterium]